MKTQWQVKSYTSSLGETGDHFTESWIENGELKLIASYDLESDEELHEIANALNSFEALDQQNKELRGQLGAANSAIYSLQENLTYAVKTKELENEGWKSMMTASEAEIQRLTKEVEEFKKPLTDDERNELEILRGHRNNPTRWMSQEEQDRLAILVNKDWGNIHPELTRLRELLGRCANVLDRAQYTNEIEGPSTWWRDREQLLSEINALNHKP